MNKIHITIYIIFGGLCLLFACESDPIKPDKQPETTLCEQNTNPPANIADQAQLGIMEVRNGKLIDIGVLNSGEWAGEWHFGNGNKIRGKGDFDGDGLEEILITSGWGIGILSYRDCQWHSLLVKPNGTWFGGWNFSNLNVIEGIGDFDGDGKDDILISSGWGMAILSLGDQNLYQLAIESSGSWIGNWEYRADRNPIYGIGDYDGDDRDEILIVGRFSQSPETRIGILELAGSHLSDLAITQQGAYHSDIQITTYPHAVSTGDYNGDGRDDFIINTLSNGSKSGIAVLSLINGNFVSLASAEYGENLGGWHFGKDDWFQVIADFDGDKKVEILVSSDWGIGMLETTSGGELSQIFHKPNGTRFGGWLYGDFRSIIYAYQSVDDLDNDGNADFVIRSGWGIGILTLAGATLTDIDMQPYGGSLGRWEHEPSDLVETSGKFTQGPYKNLLYHRRGR